jgi:anthranilate phosphoribosyltransferase
LKKFLPRLYPAFLEDLHRELKTFLVRPRRETQMSKSIPALLKEIGKSPPSAVPEESLLSAALTDIILGIATHAQCAALLTCLHFTKLDHNAYVISVFAKTMREHALKVHRADLGKNVPKDEYLVDIVGTGGDGWGTFNASTSAAIVAAGAGCYVCKVTLSMSSIDIV